MDSFTGEISHWMTQEPNIIIDTVNAQILRAWHRATSWINFPRMQLAMSTGKFATYDVTSHGSDVVCENLNLTACQHFVLREI